MKILFISLLLPLSLFASKILSYNIYDRTDRADIMITFDTPYSGKITQTGAKSKIIIKLEGASITSPKMKKVNSPFLQSLSITPLADHTQIIATATTNIALVASRTTDGYGLRLRFKAQSQTSADMSVEEGEENNLLSNLPTKQEDALSTSYYIVVGFLLLAIFTLFYLKRKMVSSPKSKAPNPWLFKMDEFQNTRAAQEEVQSPLKEFMSDETHQVSIRFQKALSQDTSVVMLDFGPHSYLVLMGKSNILLDKFLENRPKTQEEFQDILQKRHEQLEEFLGEHTALSKKEPLQAYKERAASIAYGEDL